MDAWTVETLKETVDEELETLPADMKARFVRVSEPIETFGPFNVGMPHIRPLSQKLWEMRARVRTGLHAAFMWLLRGVASSLSMRS